MTVKVIKSENYNLVFDSETGFTARWGKTQDEDPVMCPMGPEILDIEISTICHEGCKFCYKSNVAKGENMSLETFKTILSKFPRTPDGKQVLLPQQIAFGIGSIDANPDLWAIMEHCREQGVVPNITINGARMTDEYYSNLAKFCGAVAVSHYNDDRCFNAVDNLVKAGLKQVNIHKFLSLETHEDCFRLIDCVKTDERLKGLKAIVFLSLKKKGRGVGFHSLENTEQYKKLFEYAQSKGVQIGMDSCSGPAAFKSFPEEVWKCIDPCESTIFSLYIDTLGQAFPCSFTGGQPGWETGIDMLGVQDFKKDVWYSNRIKDWRYQLLGSCSGCKGCSAQKFCRSCPEFNVVPCKKDLK